MTGAALLLAAVLGTSPAHAQFVDCGNAGGGFPAIGGTSGLANARTALTTNRVTYSASTFAERMVFEEIARGEEGNVARAAWEQNVTYSVAWVPVVIEQDNLFTPEDCPEELHNVAMSPVDLQAQNMGFGFRHKHVGAFYSASLAFGQTAIPNTMNRIMIWSGGMLLYGPALLLAAPVSGSWIQDSGASSFAIDWIGGVFYDGEPVWLRAGYAGGSGGFYASAVEPRSAAFASLIARPGDNPLDTLRVGIDRFDIKRFGAEKVGDRIGMTTAYYRELPYGDAEEDAAGGDVPLTDRLRSGHVAQDNIMQIVDLGFAYTFQPIVSVSEVLVGIHTPGYVVRRDDPLEDQMGGASLTVGQVVIPEMYSMGVGGGSFWMFDLEASVVGQLEGAQLGGYLGIQMNHPDQLALYPFARNALSYRLSMQGRF